MLGVGLAWTVLWLFVAAYGLSFSSLRPLMGARQRFPARVESSQPVTLLTGEAARRTCALFLYEGKTWRAAAYGETTLAPGQTTTVLVPSSSPGDAWIEGLQRFPVQLSGVARLGLVTLLPGLLLSLWGLAAGWRQRGLIRDGVEVTGQRRRHLSLPRPLSDRYLDEYELQSPDGARRRVWSIGPDGPAQARLLVSAGSWRGAAVLSHLLPAGGVGSARRISSLLVLALVLAQTGVLALFLLT